MIISRRKFMKAGIVAATCAGLPLRSALAEDGSPSSIVMSAPDTSSLEQLSYYTKSTFDPYVDTKFNLHLGPSNTRGLKLFKVGDYPNYLSGSSESANSPETECFYLLLTIASGKPFDQDTYLIEHKALGTFYMFVVPVGARSKNLDYYEAVIYRRQHNSVIVTEARPTINDTRPIITAIPPQSIWSTARAYGGGVTESPAVRGNSKEEQEIYYFRPLPIDPSIALSQTEARIARARRAASKLTMAQAPAISDLKLGMTTEQVLALFPGSKDDEEVRASLSRPPSRFGVSGFMIKPEKYSSKSKFDRIRELIFTLLDGRVSTLYVGYDGPVWEYVDEFVTKFSEEKSLPAGDSWEAYVGMDTQLKTLKGKDFEISLFAGGQNVEINYVQMRDMAALQKYKQRRAKAKEVDGAKS